MKSEDYIKLVGEGNPDALSMDDLDDAIIGIASQYTKPPLLVYSAKKIIENLVRRGMSEEEAGEYFDFNIACAWMGEGTPLIMHDRDDHF